MATTMKMPDEVVEGRLVVVSSKVSSNFLLTTSLIAASVYGTTVQWLSAFLFTHLYLLCPSPISSSSAQKK